MSLNLFLVLFAVFCVVNCPGLCKMQLVLAEVLFKRIGARATTFIAGTVFCSGFLISSYITDPYVFIVVFGVMLGLGEGMTLMTPVWSVWKYFPHSKGKATGAVLFGYGFGPSIFGLAFTFLANPNNDSATLRVTNGATSYYLFDHNVADNIPRTLRYFALILGSLYFISMLLISEPNTETITGSIASIGPVRSGVPQCPNLKTAFGTLVFWQLFAAMSLGLFYGVYMLTVYKAFGQKYESDDYYLSILGAVGIVFNAMGRFFLPASLDYVPFKVTFSISLSVQIVLGATFCSVAEHKTLFALWLCASFFSSGGVFAMFAIQCSKVFGQK